MESHMTQLFCGSTDHLAVLHEHVLPGIAPIATTLFVVCTPLTHMYSMYCHHRCQKPLDMLRFPFGGGTRHAVFQMLSWFLWVTSVLGASHMSRVSPTHRSVAQGAITVSSFMAQLLMCVSVLVFAERRLVAVSGNRTAVKYLVPHVSTALVILMGVALAVCGLLLLLAIEYLPDLPSRILYCCLSLSCLLLGASCTHGLGGHLLYRFNAVHEQKRRSRAGRLRSFSHGPGSMTSRAAVSILDVATSAMVAVGGTCARAVGGTCARLSLDGQPTGLGDELVSDMGLQTSTSTAGASAQNGVVEDAQCGSHAEARNSGSEMSPALQGYGGAAGGRRKGPSGAAPKTPAASPSTAGHELLHKGDGAATLLKDGQSQNDSTPRQRDGGLENVAWSTAHELVRRPASENSTLAPLPGGPAAAAVFGAPAAAAQLQPFPRGPAAKLQSSLPRTQHRRSASCETPCSRSSQSAADAASVLLQQEAEEDDVAGEELQWRFYQPFVGGTAFIATQALGWSLCGGAAVCLMALLRQLAVGVAYTYTRFWALGAGSLMMAANVVLGVSLFIYQTKRAGKGKQARRTYSAWFHLVFPVLLMYLPVHVFFSAWALSFAFLPPRAVYLTWATVLVPYYIYGLLGEPEHTGCNRWPLLCAYVSKHIEQCLAYWFGSLQVIKDFKGGQLDPSKRYIFGFHPHGLYPTGAGFLPMMPSFMAATGLTPTTMVASVMFFVPGLREIVSWAGFRQVSRRTFLRALREEGSVIMCPGGQAELVYTDRAFEKDREVVIYAGHKGFVRLAIEQGASVVPVLALGEALQLANGWNWPSMQKYTYKRLGFPFPYWMVGRWRITPLPSRTPLVYVIGTPLPPPPHSPGADVEQADVDALHRQFYESLQALYLKYQHLHPELKSAQLRVLWKDSPLA